jgi:pimeloyl-ACP methyl ester carboxylesterase
VKLFKGILWLIIIAIFVFGLDFLIRPIYYLNEWTYFQEWKNGIESRDVTVSGIRMHYTAEGPAGGQPVLLVHGLGVRGEEWAALAPYLVQAGYHVYMPDLPGYGRSQKPRDFSYSVHDEAELVAGFIDSLGLTRVDLGGWSMGGGIAQHVAFEHPDHVRKLMLFDAVGLNQPPAFDTRLFTPESGDQLFQLQMLLSPHPAQLPSFIVRDVLKQSHRNEWVVKRAIASMLAGADATDSILPQLKMPVLIVWGSEDRIFPVSQAETMHRLVPQSELDIVPGCGHLAPKECTAQVGPMVVAFEME